MTWTSVALWLILALVVLVKYWRVIFRAIVHLVSMFTDKIVLEKDSVSVRFPVVAKRVEGVVTIALSEPRLRFLGLHVPLIRVELEIVQLKKKPDVPSVAQMIHETAKSKTGKLFKVLRWILRFSVAKLEIVISFKNPPKVPTPADTTGGHPWSTTIVVEDLSIGSKMGQACVLVESVAGMYALHGRTRQWLALNKLSVGLSTDELGVEVESVTAKASVEAFYAIFPTLAPLIEVKPGVASAASPEPRSLPFVLKLSVSDTLAVELETERAGTCRIGISKIQGSVTQALLSQFRVGGCLMTRDSPDHGEGEMVKLPSFTVSGSATLVDVDIPHGHLRTSPDGLVYWVRAILMCANKFSFVKRPWRLGVRNARTWAYYDKELCGIDPPDWAEIPLYVPKIIPVQIRINFLTSLTLNTHKGEERVVTEGAVIDCNLPKREISFSASNVELFGVRGRKCAEIQKFSGWVPQFSAIVLRDSDDVLASMGKPGDDVKCHYAATSPIGPVPINICFSTVRVDFAEDLMKLIGRQVMQAVKNVRRWDVAVNYDLVPSYKPVAIRLSNIRFAPRELAPAVLDVKDFELAIGPTKDCLSFAFLGVKAWVPTTPVIAPFVHVPDPVLVTLRVKRAVPLREVVESSDFAQLPGSWRELSLKAARVNGAVVPGLHATTRFIKSTFAALRSSFQSDVLRHESSRRKGPVKTVSVDCAGGQFLVVKAKERSPTRIATEDITGDTAVRAETLAAVHFGKLSLSMENFKKTVSGSLEFLRLEVKDLVSVSVGESEIQSDDHIYALTISKQTPVAIRMSDNGMAIFRVYAAVKDCVSRAWQIDPLPKLNSVMTHIVDVNESARAISESPSPIALSTGRSPLLSGKLAFECPQGFEFQWSVPGTPAAFKIMIPQKNLSGEIVFHGFALLGDDVYRRLPDVADQVLVQWLRYPWTCAADSELQPSVQSERASWELHSIMTMRISEYLAAAGSEGRWEYASARGFIDTPMYAQLLLEVGKVEISIGTPFFSQKIGSTERLEVRAHAHNLPTVQASSSNSSQHAGSLEDAPMKPKIKMSYWTAMEQSRREPSVYLNPIVHVPFFLQLLGSPADADSSLLELATSEDSDETASVYTQGLAGSKPSIFERFLDRVDLGFRVTISNTCGRAAGWAFAASRICVFKEEDRGKGLIVTEIRDGQVGLEVSGSLAEAVQPLHSQACWGAPQFGSGAPAEVCPFVSVKQTMVHVGLREGSDGGGEPGGHSTVVFSNIQGVRVWWSPALSRGMRQSLARTDALVATLTRWKQRFTSDLYARLGKNRRKKKTLESILKLIDWFIPSGGSVRLLLRCADVQANFHNLMHGIEDLFPATSGGGSLKSPMPRPTGPEIPKHFLPFNATPLATAAAPTVPPPRLTQTCDCCPRLSSSDASWVSKNPLDLVSPRACSWWTRAGLPPLPLAVFFAPPAARRERAVGAVEFEKWIDECNGSEQVPSPTNVKPKPRGSQLLFVATESIFELTLHRIKGPSNLRVGVSASFKNVHGSVAPTALRGLVWLGKSGQTILRQILQIPKILCVVNSELFAFNTAKVRLLVPKVVLSTDDDAFQTLIDVFRNCLLYRGQLIDPTAGGGGGGGAKDSPPPSPNPKSGAPTRFDGLVPASKREGIIEGLLTSLAVADATLEAAKDSMSVEYIVEHISVSLTHRQRCFVQLLLKQVVGKQAMSLNHPHRPMHFSFQVGDVCIVASESGGDRTVLRSAAPTGAASAPNLVTIRGHDRYITLNNREWQVYDSLFVSTSPLVVDITQDLIEELYAFVFPPTDAAPSAAPIGGNSGLTSTMLLDEQLEVAGNKLLTGRNKIRAGAKPPLELIRRDTVGELVPAAAQKPSGALIFFKFVRFGNIESIITYKGKQFSLNHLALTVKYYLRRRRLATWKEFLDEWAGKVGKQAVGAFVKHGFSRKRGIQDIIVTKFSSSSTNDVDKLLFGKFAP